MGPLGWILFGKPGSGSPLPVRLRKKNFRRSNTAASAERLPVISSATRLNDRVKAKTAISLALRPCASSQTEKGRVRGA